MAHFIGRRRLDDGVNLIVDDGDLLQAIRVEMDAHEDVLKSLEEMGVKLARNLDDGGIEKQQLLTRLDGIKHKWAALAETDHAVRCVFNLYLSIFFLSLSLYCPPKARKRC